MKTEREGSFFYLIFFFSFAYLFLHVFSMCACVRVKKNESYFCRGSFRVDHSEGRPSGERCRCWIEWIWRKKKGKKRALVKERTKLGEWTRWWRYFSIFFFQFFLSFLFLCMCGRVRRTHAVIVHELFSILYSLLSGETDRRWIDNNWIRF